jgi:hypothetical protein
MTEETKQDQVIETREENEPNIREHKAFKAVAKQKAELEARLAQIESDIKRKADEEERKKLEEQGQYRELLSKRDAEVDALRKQYESDNLKRDLRDALREAGASNSIFMRGAMASYEGGPEGIGEYVQSLKSIEMNAPFFGVQQVAQPIGQAPPAHGQASTRSTSVDWKQVREWEAGTDPAKKREAVKLISEYRQRHGEYPYKI